MHLKIVHDLFYNVQNLNSNEDVITSALATMFDKSDKFMLDFFNKVFSTKLSREKYNKIKKFYKKNGYYCDTGYALSNNAYTWLECKPKINFKPDIWLDFYKDGLEKNSPPKKDGGTILVESKIGKGALTPKQKEGFKRIATINQMQPLLRLMIDTKAHDKKSALYSMFDEIITWNDVVNFADEVIKEGDISGADDVVLSELLSFLKERLAPEFDIEEYSGEKRVKESNLLHDILYEIRKRININEKQMINPKEWKKSYGESSEEYWNNYDEHFKDLFVGKSSKHKGCDKYIVASKSKTGNFYLRFEFWREDYDSPVNADDITAIELNFKSKIWIDDWFSLMQKTNNFIDKE